MCSAMRLYCLNSEGESLGRGVSVHTWPSLGGESAMVVAAVDVCLSTAVLSLAAHVEVKCLGDSVDSVDSGVNLCWNGRCSDPRARRLFIRRLTDFEEMGW